MPQPLSNLELVKAPLYFSGVVHPVEGAISKAAGRRLAQSGQLKGWRVVFTGPELQVGLAAPHASALPCGTCCIPRCCLYCVTLCCLLR